MDQRTAVVALTQRLDALERENNRLRHVGIGILAVATVLAIWGIWASIRTANAQTPEIIAQHIKLQNSQGVTVVEIGENAADGGAELIFHRPNGEIALFAGAGQDHVSFDFARQANYGAGGAPSYSVGAEMGVDSSGSGYLKVRDAGGATAFSTP